MENIIMKDLVNIKGKEYMQKYLEEGMLIVSKINNDDCYENINCVAYLEEVRN